MELSSAWLLGCLVVLVGACSPPSDKPARDATGADDAGQDLEPVCCGCLCIDSTWSCAADTCVNAAGEAVGLAREVGFLQLDEDELPFDPERRVRLWYAFFPADEAPEDKPVLLLFNGASVPPFLLGTGTGPTFLADTELRANPSSWTRFANLLYVDPPNLGFSYMLKGAEPGSTADLDAGLHLRALLGFLKRHPALRDNPIGLVGESWGGIRATLMLDMALHYETLPAHPWYPSQRLTNELIEHFAAVFGGDGKSLTPEEVASQFRYQVFIQGSAGYALPLVPCNDPEGDTYQCDAPLQWTLNQVDLVVQHLLEPAAWQAIWGSDLGTVSWLLPAARAGALPRDASLPTPAMDARLGGLANGEGYYTTAAKRSLAGRDHVDATLVPKFVDHLRLVRTLLTNADQDRLDMDQLPGALKQHDARVSAARYDEAAREGVERPGWVELEVQREQGVVEHVQFRMPRYPEAGHMVSLRMPGALAHDVAELLDAP
jgi:hypothetical protein